VALVEEFFDKMAADKSAAASYENCLLRHKKRDS
jgi:hypothetical protein